MKSGDWAWITLGVGVVAYEVVCEPGQLLSERMDAYRAAHPFLAYAGIVYVSAHLARIIPAKIDPLTQLTAWLNR